MQLGISIRQRMNSEGRAAIMAGKAARNRIAVTGKIGAMAGLTALQVGIGLR